MGKRSMRAEEQNVAMAVAESVTDTRRLVQVILAGGSGTRLWPVSREQYPKQLIDVVGDQSLLQATMTRMVSGARVFQAAAQGRGWTGLHDLQIPHDAFAQAEGRCSRAGETQ